MKARGVSVLARDDEDEDDDVEWLWRNSIRPVRAIERKTLRGMAVGRDEPVWIGDYAEF